jgi:hypothetical protein
MSIFPKPHTQAISSEQILSLVGSFLEPRTPSIPIPPPQRWDRLVSLTLGGFRGPQPDPWSPFGTLDRVALNPQPLPPRYLFLRALAREVINHAELLHELRGTVVPDEERPRIGVADGYVKEFADDVCGDGFPAGVSSSRPASKLVPG